MSDNDNSNVVEPLSKKEIQDWVDALESGEYKKGVNRLYNLENDSYCCLGVLAKLKNELDDVGRFKGGTRIDLEILSSGVIKYFYIETNHNAALVNLNDSNDSFQPVVDYLKTNLLE